VGEIAVVGQDQQTLTVSVEPANVKESFSLERPPGTLSEQVGDSTPALRIIHSDHDAAGLVQGKVEMSTRGWDTSTVDSNHVTFGIHPAALLGDDLGVHFNTAVANHGLTGPARAYAGFRKYLLEPYTIRRLGH
jgi:hypothetical protein